jgi:hypothetical protein
MTISTFIKNDTTTQGSWIGVYGASGYYKLEGAGPAVVSSLPAWCSGVAVNGGALTWSFGTNTGQTEDLQRAGSPTIRDGDTWYAAGTYDFVLTVTDSNPHLVTLYFDDRASVGLVQRITVLTTDGLTTLDGPRTYSNFHGGAYAQWSITGSVAVRLDNNGSGNNAQCGALFFDEPPRDSTPPVVSSASVNAAGTTLTVNFTETGSPPVLPASGATGFSLAASGGAVTLSGWTRTGTAPGYFTATTSRTIRVGETLTLAYSSSTGNVTDSATPPNALATFSGTAVTNGSTQNGPVLTPALIVFGSSGPGGITLSGSAASGGTAPYSYQWYRDTSGSNFTPGARNILTGKTSLSSWTDTTVSAGTLYYYKIVATDSASATATSSAQAAQVYQGGAISGGGQRRPRLWSEQ